MKGKTCSKLANGLKFYDLKKKLTPGVAVPGPGVIYIYMYIIILVKQVNWYILQVSGERLQNHGSSGLFSVGKLLEITGLCKNPYAQHVLDIS